VRKLLPILVITAVLIPIGAMNALAGHHDSVKKVTVPEGDVFAPFAVTIRAGDSVLWTNNDEDDHTVVSDDPFNTAGHKGTDEILSADGGTFALRFDHPGTFVYYCRFHSHLNALNQPVAPGPDGGFQSQDGNFGLPMSGVITVLPGN
jgi:plastocyanin